MISVNKHIQKAFEHTWDRSQVFLCENCGYKGTPDEIDLSLSFWYPRCFSAVIKVAVSGVGFSPIPTSKEYLSASIKVTLKSNWSCKSVRNTNLLNTLYLWEEAICLLKCFQLESLEIVGRKYQQITRRKSDENNSTVVIRTCTYPRETFPVLE